MTNDNSTAGSEAPASVCSTHWLPVRIERGPDGLYGLIINGKEHERFVYCDFGGGSIPFRTRFYWRAKLEAAHVINALLDAQAKEPWRAGARLLYEKAHTHKPFMTCETGADGFRIVMQFKTLIGAQQLHSALCNFFASNQKLSGGVDGGPGTPST